MFQLLMIGVFALKQNALVSSFCIPLPVLTFVFYKYIRNNFDRSTVSLNLSLAKEIKTPEKEFLKVQSIVAVVSIHRVCYIVQGQGSFILSCITDSFK